VSLFDRLVDQALQAQTDLAVLRPVVEREIIHRDILREMGRAGLLSGLTFIGGTCLRACYGSPRLSEDLDFTGGANFQKEDLAGLGQTLVEKLEVRYGLPIRVSAPAKTGGNVSTWKLTVETRPQRRDLPAQRIHIGICSLPSHDRRPMVLRNPYGIDLGTSGLILQAESREEILADKIIALAFRENRVKNRDLWDIAWLAQSGATLPAELIPPKIADHRRTALDFAASLAGRLNALRSERSAREDFLKEMRRFLPADTVRNTLENPDWWSYLMQLLAEHSRTVLRASGA
jgi:predicted nucleotidyltransferase component of viral defense system